MKRQNLKELSKILGFTPKIDGFSSLCADSIRIDIIAFDQQLENKNIEYDSNRCSYKNHKDISMAEFIEIRYGLRAVELIKTLI